MTITQTNQPNGQVNTVVASRDFYLKVSIGGAFFFTQSIVAPEDFSEADAEQLFTECSRLDLPTFNAKFKDQQKLLAEMSAAYGIDLEAEVAAPAAGAEAPAYKYGELVKKGELRAVGDDTYRCLKTHGTEKGLEPAANPTLWALVTPVAEGEAAAWDSERTYQKGETAVFGGVTYTALDTTRNNQPDKSAKFWAAVTA